MQTSKIQVVGQFLFLISTFLLINLFLPLQTLALDPFKTFMLLAVGVLLGMGFVVQKIKKNSFHVTRNPLWLSVGAIVLASVLSTVFSSNPALSLFGRQVNTLSLLSILALFALSYGVMSMFTDAQQKGRFFLVTYVSALLAVIMHLLNVVLPFFPAMGFFFNNTINTIGKWFELGFLSLFVLLSSVLVLQFLRHSTFYKVLGWIGFVSSALMVILVNSLLIWGFAAGFALIYIVLNAIIQHDALVHNRLSYPALGILILSIIFMLVGGKVGALSNQFFGIQFEEVRPTFSSTVEVIGDTLKKDPVFGAGLNRFEVSWLENKPVGVNASDFWDTDFRFGFSNIMSVPVTQGVVGTLAWLAFLIAGAYYAFKLLFVPLEQKSDLFINLYSAFGFSFFTLVMALYVPSVVLVGLFFIFFGFFLANLNAVGLIRYREVQIDQNPRVSFAYILSLVVVLIAFIYAGYIFVSQYGSRVMFDRTLMKYQATGDLVAAETGIKQALFIYNSDLYLRSLVDLGMAKVNGVLQNQSLSQEQAVQQFTATLQNTVATAQAAIAYDPQSYANRMTLATVYRNLVPLQVPGALDEALKVLGEAEKLTPNNPSINLEKARVYSLAKQYDRAIDEIKWAINFKPNYVDAAFLLSQIQVEQGKIDEAVASIQAALSVDPYNSNLYFQLGLLKYNQEKYNEAVTVFENAVMLSPYFGNAKYFLGLSYYQNGRTNDAILQFEDLARLYPQNTEVTFILNNLKSGKAPLDGAQPPLDENPEDRDELPVDEEDPETEEASESEE